MTRPASDRPTSGAPESICPKACLDFAHYAVNSPRNPMAGLPGEMVITEAEPTVTAHEFPAQRMRCPHGVHFYAWPNVERINALRALNGVN